MSEEINNSFIEPDMVYIEGGTFQMGSNDCGSSAKPVHKVTVSSFYMGKYTVTNREYCKYVPSHENPGDNLPVVQVSQEDGVDYCNWLSEKTGHSYRLPSEAEWEYACRAGSTTKYYWGDKMESSYCWYIGNSGKHIHPAGEKKPNMWNLYDMSGNVWEWCSDFYGNYPSGSVINPAGPDTGFFYIFRGGDWNGLALGCRSAYRNYGIQHDRCKYIGFRIVRSQP